MSYSVTVTVPGAAKGQPRPRDYGILTTMNTTWKPVVGFESLYEVSDYGEVRRPLDATAIGNVKPGKRLSIVATSNGYRKISLSKSGKESTHLVHALVAAAFIGPRPPGHQINHIDGNKVNNHTGNLEYVSAGENSQHAIQTGLYPSGDRNGSRTKPAGRPRGERNSQAKANEATVAEVRSMRASGKTLAAIAAHVNLSLAQVHNIVTRASWSHIP